MNKTIKLSLITLLGIGSISIASLPLVSCGSSETTPTTPTTPPPPVIPTLGTEGAKLQSKPTKINNESTAIAYNKINDAQDKNAELKRYYEVKLAEGFSYKYESSTIEGSTLNVIVVLSVSGSSSITQQAFKITGFADLNSEKNKLTTQNTKITNEAALLAKTNIDEAANKDVKLRKYYEVELAEGFSYNYRSSVVEDSTLSVTIVLLEGTAETGTVDIAITGFVSFSSEENKLIDKVTQITNEATSLSKSNIDGKSNQAGKDAELKRYYEVDLAKGFSYSYKSSEVADSILNVTVTLVGNGISKDLTFGITGFVSFSSQEPKFGDKATKIGGDKTARFAVEAINGISSQSGKNDKLAEYYDSAKLADGFSYNYKSSNESYSTLNVTVTLVGNGISKDVTFGITGFQTPITKKSSSVTDLALPKYIESANKMINTIRNGTDQMRLVIAQEFLDGVTIQNISNVEIEAKLILTNQFEIKFTIQTHLTGGGFYDFFNHNPLESNIASKELIIDENYIEYLTSGIAIIDMDKIKTTHPNDKANPKHPDNYKSFKFDENVSLNIARIQHEFLNYFNNFTTINRPTLGFPELSVLSTGNYIESIATNTFDNAPLQYITLGNSVTTIGDNAFKTSIYRGNLIVPSQFDNDAELARIGITIIKNNF